MRAREFSNNCLEKKKGNDKSTTSAINMLRATANTSCIIWLSKRSRRTRSPAAHQRLSPLRKSRRVRSETSAGTYRSREPAALSEAPQPRKLTTFSASDRHLCVSTALTPKPLNKQSTSSWGETNKKRL